MRSNNSREGSSSAGFFAVPAAMFPFLAAFFLFVFSLSARAHELPGLSYTNFRDPSVPLSIHVVRLALAQARYRLESLHAQGQALGLDTLSDQVTGISPAFGSPAAAINGDFYEREGPYAGAPRGLQIINGELISGPSGEAGFWMDALGAPHAAAIEPRFDLTWPDGSTVSFQLNSPRADDAIVLYTAAIGASTKTSGGRELILDNVAARPWLPLRIGKSYKAAIREIRNSGDTTLSANILVLSLGPKAMAKAPALRPGGVLEFSTGSEPPLHGIKTAIGGGPLLLKDDRRVPLQVPDSQSYQVTTMRERHPRAAIGWNDKYLFFVEVDGRQRKLSEGLTLEELAKFLLHLGCTDAMNFDGGGSATLWFDGAVRNSPCDRMEREIANGLAIVMKKP